MHKKPVLIIIILLLLLSFISCTPKTKDEAEIEIKPEDIFGTWTSETTYENEQLGIKSNLQKEFAKKEKEDPSVMEKVHEMLVKWEEADPEVRKLWEMMNSWVFEGF